MQLTKQYAIMYQKIYLVKNKAEVTDMLLTEFDEKAYIEGVKKQSYADGEEKMAEKATQFDS